MAIKIPELNKYANKDSEEVQRKLVVTLKAMLNGKVPFLEGADLIHNFRYHIVHITHDDSDFNILDEVVYRTAHLPLTRQRYLWSQEALIRIEPEIKRREEWAKLFAAQACINLIERFDVRL